MELKMIALDGKLDIEPSDPRLFEPEFKEYCRRNEVVFKCTCCDKKLLYRFSKSYHFIPFSHAIAQGHTESCPLNKRFLERDKNSNAVQIEPETRTLHVNVIDRLWEPPRKREQFSAPSPSKARYESEEQKRPHWSSVYKDVNCEVSYKNAHNRRQKMPYKGYKEYTAQVYMQFSGTVFDGNGTTLGGKAVGDSDSISHDFNGVQFNCARLFGVASKADDGSFVSAGTPTRETYIEGGYDEMPSRPYLIFEDYVNKSSKPMLISQKALCDGFGHYMKTYGFGKVKFKDDIVIGAFYSYLHESKGGFTYRMIDRFVPILVNKYGLFCESRYEVTAYDIIMDNYTPMDGCYFYKPYRFTDTVYNNGYREDGRIEVEGGKTIVLEVFGANTEEYRKRKAAKEDYLKRRDDIVMLTWDIVDNRESAEDFRDKLKEAVKRAKEV